MSGLPVVVGLEGRRVGGHQREGNFGLVDAQRVGQPGGGRGQPKSERYKQHSTLWRTKENWRNSTTFVDTRHLPTPTREEQRTNRRTKYKRKLFGRRRAERRFGVF